MFRFYEKLRITGVIGVINGTHIAIVLPKLDDVVIQNTYILIEIYNLITINNCNCIIG